MSGCPIKYLRTKFKAQMEKETTAENNAMGNLHKPPVSCRYFWLKYWLVAWIGCCLMLGTIFYMDIQHQKRMDKIWDKYEQDMKLLHNGN